MKPINFPVRESSSSCTQQIDIKPFDYNSPNWRYKREGFINWLSVNCNYDFKRRIIKTRWLKSYLQKVQGVDCNIDYVPEFSLYKLVDFGQGYELNEGEKFDVYNFDPGWNVRDILLSEAVIEIESENQHFNIEAVWKVAENLEKLKIHYVIFGFEGMRSPHIHIYDLFPNINNWAEKELSMALFCREVVPFEYFHLVDKALWGEHTIALEFAPHYRTGYTKKLCYEFVPGGASCN